METDAVEEHVREKQSSSAAANDFSEPENGVEAVVQIVTTPPGELDAKNVV